LGRTGWQEPHRAWCATERQRREGEASATTASLRITPMSKLDSVPNLKSVLSSAPPTLRAASRDLPPELRIATPRRMRYQLCLVFADAKTRSGQRIERYRFTDPRKVLGLLRRACETPHRPLLGAMFDASAAPRWIAVPLDFIRARAAQKAARGGAR
jgi:hypothetical protein